MKFSRIICHSKLSELKCLGPFYWCVGSWLILRDNFHKLQQFFFVFSAHRHLHLPLLLSFWINPCCQRSRLFLPKALSPLITISTPAGTIFLVWHTGFRRETINHCDSLFTSPQLCVTMRRFLSLPAGKHTICFKLLFFISFVFFVMADITFKP